MEVIYGLIPGMLLLGLVAVGVLFWAARTGQFDDLDGDAHRILMDEDVDERAARRFPDAEDDGRGEQDPR
jgi:cbb3-type cytochrome oxidase maturation protein